MNIAQDVRYSMRQIIRARATVSLILLTLAIGIGAITVMFSILNGVLLRPLPFVQPDRIVEIAETGRDDPDVREAGFSLDHFREWRDHNTVFESMAAYQGASFTATLRDEPVRVEGLAVSTGFFDVLGAAPRLGQTFERTHEEPGNERVIVLSNGLWRRLFGSDPQIVGQSLDLDGRPFQVLAVMPAEFQFPADDVGFWIPLLLSPPSTDPNVRRVIAVPVIARLEPGVSLEKAQAEGRAIVSALRSRDRGDRETVIRLRRLLDRMVGEVKPALLALSGAVGLLLLIACANVANLQLVRAAGRGREMAVRSTLGADRRRLVQQVLIENCLLGLAGGVGGLILSLAGLRLVKLFASNQIPRLSEVAIDGTTVLACLLISVGTGIVFGCAPAFLISKTNVASLLKGGGEKLFGGSGGRSQSGLRAFLAVAQISVALVLLVGAGLLMLSFLGLIHVDQGLDPEDVVVMGIELPGYRYPAPASRKTFFDDLLIRVRALPQVEEAALSNALPLSGFVIRVTFDIEGRPRPANPEDSPRSSLRLVSPGYFQTLGIKLRDGRVFAQQDRAGAPPVVMINQSLSDRYFAGERVVGRRTQFGEIVGVVANVKNEGARSEDFPEIYVPIDQASSMMAMSLRSTYLILTSGATLGPLVEAIRSQIRSLDSGLPPFDAEPLQQRYDESVAQPRLYAALLTGFALISLLVAAVGLYGVVSQSVARQTHETGIRMALGARRIDILWRVMLRGGLLALVGVALGTTVSVGMTGALGHLLFGVEPRDPVLLAATAVFMLLVSLVATFLPARRATRLDPWQALRTN